MIDGKVEPKTLPRPAIYSCTFQACGETGRFSEMMGNFVGGKVDGRNLKLIWPMHDPRQCVDCRPSKSFLGIKHYNGTFGSREFTGPLGAISKENLVLKDGFSASGGFLDWLKYTITLRKIG